MDLSEANTDQISGLNQYIRNASQRPTGIFKKVKKLLGLQATDSLELKQHSFCKRLVKQGDCAKMREREREGVRG